MKKYNCWDCLGSGKKSYYHMIDNGICYTCGGTGLTNKIQGEASKKYQENLENKKLHFQILKRIEKGEKITNHLAVEIGKKIKKEEDVKEDVELLTKYNNVLKKLKESKEKLEKIINWAS